jgi:hypothetical protein
VSKGRAIILNSGERYIVVSESIYSATTNLIKGILPEKPTELRKPFFGSLWGERFSDLSRRLERAVFGTDPIKSNPVLRLRRYGNRTLLQFVTTVL